MTNDARLLREQEIKSLKGLSQEEVLLRLKKFGPNELAQTQERGVLKLLLHELKEPMILLLLAVSTLYYFMGDIQEAIMMSVAVVAVILLTLYQERKTEKSIQALRDLTSPRALALRGGEHIRIPGREVVPGDLLILNEGDRVPADCILIWGHNVRVDESLLTGESAAVDKLPGAPDSSLPEPGQESTHALYSATLIVSGKGVALVAETGSRTQIGKIGKAIGEIKPEQTLLQKETGRIVRVVFMIAAVLCAGVALFYGFVHHDWLKGTLSGLTLAMAMIPEEFPVILTVFFALGAWRMSRRKVLTRHVSAIETLGAATVLCSDKTGTLTLNRMTLQRLLAPDGTAFQVLDDDGQALPEEVHEIIEYGVLASQTDPFDPMEKAFRTLGTSRLADTEHLHDNWHLVRQYPLSQELLAMAHVWESKEGEALIVAAKGAPESVVELCHLPAEAEEEILSAARDMAGEGLRVLGVAKGRFREKNLPGHPHDFDFDFVGLAGFRDPIRPEVPAAVAECRQAGIRVIMITGDYPATAQHIARQIGMERPEQVLTGADMKQLSAPELLKRVHATDIYARIMPEQKLQLVELLKQTGEVVVMTGDGVNDAPALKAAHIGIAMGGRGTDVAREAAGLVLQDDSFSSIVAGVKQGRQISENLRKAMSYVISVHIPFAALAVIPVLLQWPVEILTAVHIVFLELITDPTCSVAFEGMPPEKDLMVRKPRRRTENLLNYKAVIPALVRGIICLGLVFGAWYAGAYIGEWENRDGKGVMDEARTLSFASLICINIALVLSGQNLRPGRPAEERNRTLPWIIGGTLALLMAVMYIPFLQQLFHFTALHVYDWIVAAAAATAGFILFEVMKRLVPQWR